MIGETFDILAGWSSLDTGIVLTAAMAALACALPGNYLVLRRQSMLGDALSHTALLGVVGAFLIAHALKESGYLSAEMYASTRHATMFLGAIVIGVLTAVLTEGVQKLGRVEGSAALGVVFTTLFALGLLLIRLVADDVHIDPDCVLYGTVETSVMDTVFLLGLEIPRAAVLNGTVFLINLVLVLVFYKELRISTFDPALATAQGINAHVMHYGLMAATALTLMAAFESVGSILVIAMLIVPPATAYQLTDRLGTMIVLSLVVAVASAILGHVLALTIPPVLLAPLGFESLSGVSASTAGMMAAACGLLFLLAAVFGPRYGILSRAAEQARLSLRIASEDVLGLLYRMEEMQVDAGRRNVPELVGRMLGIGRVMTRVAVLRLSWQGRIVGDASGYHLTSSGRDAAANLVRSHRLWESYMAKHFAVPEDHLHETAARVEHYLDPALQNKLAQELDRPDVDPHGKAIPGSGEDQSKSGGQ